MCQRGFGAADRHFRGYGKHARAALGINELPFGTPVEIEMIVELKEGGEKPAPQWKGEDPCDIPDRSVWENRLRKANGKDRTF